MPRRFFLMLTLVAGGCASAPLGPQQPVGLGETFWIGKARFTPLAVLEDSRCPGDVFCVQAGQVRVRTRVQHGRHVEEVEFVSPSSGENPHCVVLASVTPSTSADVTIGPSAYRFAFADDDTGDCDVQSA